MTEHVTILGDGAMATVCSILLSAGNHPVTLWSAFEESIERLQQNRENAKFLPGVRVPRQVRLTANEGEALKECTLVVSAIPTQYMRNVWKRVKPHLPQGTPIVSVAKGIENESLLRPTQIIADVLGGIRSQKPEARSQKDPHPNPLPVGEGVGPQCDWPLAALSGPNIAGEIARYLPATAVVATGDMALAERIQKVFTTPWYRLYTNPDITGVELAGATKNVIAIAAGILDGLAAGNNAKAALVTRGLVEITRLGVAMGAREETFHGLAGAGDLITTCVSPEGRNRTVGERIGKGERLKKILESMDSVAEGVPTTKSVHELARRFKVEMPITESVYAVLFEDKDVIHALTDLMMRDPKPERNG